MIANHDERTFELLRYHLGGNRPSQTDHLTLFPSRIHGKGVRILVIQNWYFTVASTPASAGTSTAPSYATYEKPRSNIRIQ